MEHYSPKFRTLLKRVIKAWILERRDEEELCFTFTTLGIKTKEEEQSWAYTELLAEEEEISQEDLVEQCLAELEGVVTTTVIFPFYVDKPEDFRFRYLIENVAKDSFQNESAIKRLETYYYLGEVLTSRGWTNEDNKLLLEVFNERRIAYLRTVSKKVYELFSTRGIAHLYAASFIKPTHLVRISKADFYGRLMPAVRTMRFNELISESSQELTE